tara:strand:+ start:10726 stop:11646 length:921 start_codon:yes stop_codon:yes gene_type:complete
LSQPPVEANPVAPTEATETRLLVSYGFDLARQLGIQKVLVLANLVIDRKLVEKHRDRERLIWVTHEEDSSLKTSNEDYQVTIPESSFDRMDQLTLALMMAVMSSAVDVEESVVCLTGTAGSKRLDTLLIANPKRDFPWFARTPADEEREQLRSREFVRLIEIAVKLASEGREGKPIGTILVLGETAEIEKHIRPLILNPCSGHPRRARNIHDPSFLETIRELSAIDGAFVIDPKGVVEHAGVYLSAPLRKKIKIEKGLGSRHLAAVSLTGVANAIAIVVSESSGRVTVYSQGAQVMALESRRASSN